MKINKKFMMALAMSTALTSPTLAEGTVDEIKVTASKMDRELEDMTTSISVVTADEIEQQMVTDLNELFKNTPGINVTGDSGGSQNIIVRGMGGDRVLMIKDGMRMNEGYGADGRNDIVGRGFIDLDTVKQVEVAKGPASSLFGADAMGGIVVFTTKDADDYLDGDEKVHVGFRAGYAGSNDENSYGATTAFKLSDNFGLVISATERAGHETQNFDETKENKDIDSTSLLVKTNFDINDSNTLSLTYDLWEQDGVQPDDPAAHGEWLSLSGYDITFWEHYADKKNESWKIDYGYTGDKIESLDISYYENDTKQEDGYLRIMDVDSAFAPGSPYIRDTHKDNVYEQETKGLLVNMVSSFDLGSTTNQYAVGFDIEESESSRTARELRIRDGSTVTRDDLVDKFPGTKVERYGIYFSDYMDLPGGKVSLNFGTRYDHFKMTPKNTVSEPDKFAEVSDGNISSNAGILYKLNDNVSLTANYSQGFKVPPYDLAYLEHDNTFAGYIIHPADDLDPETSESFEVGVRVDKDDWNFSAYVFQNDFEDFITPGLFDVTPSFFGPIEHFKYENIDEVRIKGAEASVSYQATDSVELYANIAYQDGKDQITKEYIDSIEPLSGTIGLSYTGVNHGADLSMRWADDMDKVNAGEYENPSYQVVDLTTYVTYEDRVTFRFGVLNMFDQEYTEHKSTLGVGAGGDASYYTRPGREVTARVAVDF